MSTGLDEAALHPPSGDPAPGPRSGASHDRQHRLRGGLASHDRQHRLRGGLVSHRHNRRDTDQREHQVTTGGTVRHVIDDDQHTVWLIHASPRHPKDTGR